MTIARVAGKRSEHGVSDTTCLIFVMNFLVQSVKMTLWFRLWIGSGLMSDMEVAVVEKIVFMQQVYYMLSAQRCVYNISCIKILKISPSRKQI